MTDPPDRVRRSRSAPVSARARARTNVVLTRLSELGASAQAAIPGLYAWSITVAPAAWSRGAPLFAKVAAIIGVIALVTAPLVEGAGLRRPEPPPPPDPTRSGPAGPRTRRRRRAVWRRCAAGPDRRGRASGRCGASSSRARSSGRSRRPRSRRRGSTAFAARSASSAGRSSRSRRRDRRFVPIPTPRARIVAGSALKPRSELPRGDGAYVAAGVVLALAMQGDRLGRRRPRSVPCSCVSSPSCAVWPCSARRRASRSRAT